MKRSRQPHTPSAAPALGRIAAAVRQAVRRGGLAGAMVLTASGVAHAQTPADEPPALQLQPSWQLLDRLTPDAQRLAPSFVSAQRMSGSGNGVTTLEGEVVLRRHDAVVRADKLDYNETDQQLHAQGQVRIVRDGNLYEGPELQLQLDTHTGFFLQPTFSLLRGGQGEAERLDFIDENRSVARRASYTTCTRRPGPSWLPDWVVSAASIEFDQAEEVAYATNGVLKFKDVPLLAAPYLSFPISDKRKSGLLPPTLNIDNISGLELTLPYYLNLSPQRDATLYPTLMSRRGIDLAGEYRYLDTRYHGQLRGAYMPDDKLRDSSRWAYAAQHNQVLDTPLGLGPVGLRLNLNRVSDDDYWRDFPRSMTSLTSRLLANEGVLSWSRGPWAVSAGAYRWQTLQDVDAPIVAPFDRLPSLTARFAQTDQTLAGGRGWDWSLHTEATRFSSDRIQTGNNLDGTRLLGIGAISRTWATPAWYLTPRLQVHATQYQTQAAMADGRRTASRVLPTFSVDTGLFYERDTRFFGRDVTQTLEPRVFYAHTPYKDQRLLPNYDAAAFDFNLATIYTENPYGGQDRIADAHVLTLGATSRLIDPGSGRELAKFGVAQRVRLSDQNVFLPGAQPVAERLSDILVGARLNWTPQWSFESNVQFNPKSQESVRTTLSARHTPGDYRVVSAAYRLQRGTSEQLDVGWQWPLSWGGDLPDSREAGGGLGAGRWYSVGRVNYSVPDRKVVDLVAGFEYDAGCWIGRVVVESLQRSLNSANRRILFQLEFVGFTRVGSNPLKTLKDNVPRYQYLREEINPPSRFSRYE
ncbi:LPS-assembly protein LptD [Hydrogenophaga defluvii]|uniref:LPS-assembly protein LptD n=1 Tax=Hydrogenophaga defluvii TaxID=249410 RepID=A0ABW2SAP8_9BURK